jgi:opacity protein-like surface antigen
MRRVSLLAFLVIACVPRSLAAQDTRVPDPGRWEWFIGSAGNHTYYEDEPIDRLPPTLASLFTDRAQGLGFETALTTLLTRHVGITSDFSMYFRNGPSEPGVYRVRSNAFFLMAGPELKVRTDARYSPFVHLLTGVAHTTARFTLELPDVAYADSHARTGVAFAVGGGLDVRVSARWSLRSAFEYARTALGDADPAESRWQTHNRLALGLVLR